MDADDIYALFLRLGSDEQLRFLLILLPQLDETDKQELELAQLQLQRAGAAATDKAAFYEAWTIEPLEQPSAEQDDSAGDFFDEAAPPARVAMPLVLNEPAAYVQGYLEALHDMAERDSGVMYFRLPDPEYGDKPTDPILRATYDAGYADAQAGLPPRYPEALEAERPAWQRFARAKYGNVAAAS